MARRTKQKPADKPRTYTRQGDVRTRILNALTRPMTHDQIVAASGVDGKKVSNHLFVMKKAGMVRGERTGNASSQKLWARVGAAPAREAALVNAVNTPPKGKDAIAVVLHRAVEQAQDSLDAYVVSACDQRILGHLKQARDAARQAFAEYKGAKAA